MVVIIDYNIGNLSSVISALKRVGIEAVITRDKDIIRQAKAIVLPGVGAFPVAMNNLKKFDLIDVLNERKDAGIPILGICLGMQILFEKGYEVEETKGLGFLDGEVVFMDIDEKVPHMGWNQLHFNQNQYRQFRVLRKLLHHWLYQKSFQFHLLLQLIIPDPY